MQTSEPVIRVNDLYLIDNVKIICFIPNNFTRLVSHVNFDLYIKTT